MTNKPLTIVGAGMAGLLAGNLLARRSPVIFEKQSKLPNNHSAVLRFRTPIVGEALGIPFTKVNLIKTVVPWKNSVADALAYSRKNTGTMRSDRSVLKGNSTPGGDERWIAPHDLIAKMAERCNITFGTPYNFGLATKEGNLIISTLPMPFLMMALDYPFRSEVAESFQHVHGYNITANIMGCRAYAGVQVPDPDVPFSRVSLTDNQMIVEIPSADEGIPQRTYELAHLAASYFGVAPEQVGDIMLRKQQYAKILPIEEAVRRDFIHWATMVKGVYSLGRFATWRPNLLLDDLVKDIRMIDGWIERNDRYGVALVR